MQNEISVSAKNILMKYMEELESKELKKFKVLLKDYPVKEGHTSIPTARLENADYLDISEQMIIHYQESYALEMAGNVLYQIPRMDLLEQFKCDSQNCLDTNTKLWETNYKAYIIEKFRFIQDNNGRIGENISLNKRYTKLLIIKEHCLQAEREHEIMSSGRKHLEIMAQRAEHSYSSIGALFDPDKDGHVPRTVVLQGVAGIGKTMTARKIMIDWASGELFQDRFHYVFYINCREINHLSGQKTIAELLSHSCPGMSLSMREIEADPGKLLFIIDGFDELNISIDPTAGDPSKGTHMDNTMTLIRTVLLFKSYVIITTRASALQKLRKYVVASRFAEILGFSEDDRKEYFTKFFNSETQGAQAFEIMKRNDIVFTMCFVPIVCWIVCTVIKQQLEENEDPVYALRTTTSVYMYFLSNLLKQQSSDSVQPIQINLQRLCALAKEGVCQQKILFEEEDLIHHSLAVPAVQSLFLKNDIFQNYTECENCYSFIHLSFQEFFAAMFYVLRENEETKARTINPIAWMQGKLMQLGIINHPVISLLDASRTQKHFALTVHFLFGLLNKETLNQMVKRFKWKISSDIKPALLKWIKNEMKQDFSEINHDQMGLFHCLYEIQDEEFVRSGTEHFKVIGVGSYSLQRKMNAMDFRALGFCLKNSPGVEQVSINHTEIKPEDLKVLIPGLMACSSLRMNDCSLTGSCCAYLSSILSTNTSLTELDLSSTKLGDSGMRELCQGLKHPGCRMQTLLIIDCSLTGSCCADLSSVLRTNTSLRELNLTCNNLGDSGVRVLCEGLKHPRCRIQTLGLYCTELTDACTEALCSACRKKQTLQRLELSGNHFTESSAVAFNSQRAQLLLSISV